MRGHTSTSTQVSLGGCYEVAVTSHIELAMAVSRNCFEQGLASIKVSGREKDGYRVQGCVVMVGVSKATYIFI